MIEKKRKRKEGNIHVTHTDIYIWYTLAANHYQKRFGRIPQIVFFFKSSSEDVQVLLLVFLFQGQVGKERTLY